MYDIAIFDLDGTLLDTLDDLTDAVNVALEAYSFPTRTKAEVCRFVGNGVERLMELAVPQGKQNPAFADCFAAFKTAYAAGCAKKTKAYPGVLDMLESLKAAGVRLAVVSNKIDSAVRTLVPAYFGDRVAVAVGERQGVRRKPAPDTVWEALRQLGVEARSQEHVRAIYIGDSDVDVATARAAGLPCLSVTWGFRTREELLAAGAEHFADSAEDVVAYITTDC